MKKLTFLLSFVLVLSCAQAQQCMLRLSGHVHSANIHENISNALVILGDGRQLTTNANGDFRFDSLCSGSYTLLVVHSGFDTSVTTVLLNEDQHLDIDLSQRANLLDNVVVTGTRGIFNTGFKKELSGTELEATRGYSLGEALGELNGVALLQTGATISKPVIHGLHSNRILTINNGVRQEGQQWGNEHAPEIDPFIADRLTVIKGVDELRYGSDAIGGVVLVEPRPLRSTPGHNLEINTVFFTNNRQYVASAVFEQQLKKLPAFTYRLQGTARKGANIATPGYRLNNTALEEWAFSATAGWKKEHFRSELYYSRFNTRIGIFIGSHIGNLTDLQTAIASSRPDATFTGQNTYRIDRPYQDVTHHLLKSKTMFDVGNHRLTLQIAGQYNHRLEYDVVRNAAARGAQINLSIYSLSEELIWEHPRLNEFSGMVGLAAMQHKNTYTGRYLVPNYNAGSFGVFAIEKWSKGKWDAQAGLRFDSKDISTSRLQTATQTFANYQFDFSTLAASVNAGYALLPTWKTNLNLSLSTRAPQVNELLTNGIHHGTGTYEVGDITLKPEESLNVSLNSNYQSKSRNFSLELTLYRNRINNFIYQQPKPDEPVLTIRGAFPKVIYESTDALLHGVDVTSSVLLLSQLSLTSKYSLLRARNRRIDDWLIGMPSDRISNELRFSPQTGKRFRQTSISMEVQSVFRQKRVPSERFGRQDYKQPPAAYTLLNADLSTTVILGKYPLTIGVGGRNLLNTRYREYLNSFRYFTDQVGRNVSIRLKIELEKIYSSF